MRPETYSTPSGIAVTRTISNVSYSRGLKALLKKMDTQRGIYLSSGYEFPGRYSRWDVGAVAPPIEIIARGRDITIRPLSPRFGQRNGPLPREGAVLRAAPLADAVGLNFTLTLDRALGGGLRFTAVRRRLRQPGGGSRCCARHLATGGTMTFLNLT